MSAAYQIHRLQWEGIDIEVRYDPDWLPLYRHIYGYPLAHPEIEAVEPAKSPLPIPVSRSSLERGRSSVG